jgi:phosphoglycolate phosphatase-like HAD superfamily hydrolase
VSGSGTRQQAVADEQRHLDIVHGRVEALRRQAEARLSEVQGERLGSTFAAQFERDVISHHHAGRVARFTVGDREALLFGRLDLDDGDSLPIGRLSVMDDEGPILVDWRAPAAAPFYRATAAQPLGVARRRTILVEAARVIDVSDELLDTAAADRLGLEASTGQGALLAALERTHDMAMRDIVATIQADQDRIIRAPATGTLIVTGGPGTGKTVVALHRVAFLLYNDRERLENRGVLVVGPSRTFTDYTRRVLPSLGEDRVVQRPLEALGPVGVVAVGWDGPDVAELKGRAAMAGVCRRMLVAALPPLPPQTRFSAAGTTAVVTAERLERIRARLLERVDAARPAARYHARSGAAQDALLGALREEWERQRARHPVASGDPSPEMFAEIVLDAPEVRMLLRCFWPPLGAEDVLVPYARGERHLTEVSSAALDDAAAQLLHAAWQRSEGWSVEDVALLDEIDSLLGTRDPLPVRNEEDGPRPPDILERWYADFGHIVVDEAQDLSPMQWRAVVRRGPFASWTVVGDLAQRARNAPPSTWEEVAALIGRRNVAIERLATNYRTPAELSVLARRALGLAGHDPDGFPETVRSTGIGPRMVVAQLPEAEGLAVALRELAAAEGTIGIVVVAQHRAAAEAVVAATLDPARIADVRIDDARRVKGLEFDDLIVVAPEAILAASPLGAHDLYVALTRATRSLRIVTAQPSLPVLDVIDAHDVVRV